MTPSFLRPVTVAALACAAAIAFASPSFAAITHLKASLSGMHEVPPTDSKGKGAVTGTYNSATKVLSWHGTYSGLTGPATAAHFHAGLPGKNGGVVVPIFAGKMAKSPFKGSKKLTDAQAKAMLAGGWYVNIHTKAHPAGEIRGQFTK